MFDPFYRLALTCLALGNWADELEDMPVARTYP